VDKFYLAHKQEKNVKNDNIIHSDVVIYHFC